MNPELDAGTVFDGIIECADILGYVKTRVDQYTHPSGAYVRTNYGCGEVTLLLSHLPLYRVIRTPDEAGWRTIRGLLRQNTIEAEKL